MGHVIRAQQFYSANQISQMYSFKSTKISIWFGACKMRRLNQALVVNRFSLIANG